MGSDEKTARMRKLAWTIATDKALFSSEKCYLYDIFIVSQQKLCCGYSLEAPRRGASYEYHNICFRREIRKILCGYPLLSVAILNLCVHICYNCSFPLKLIFIFAHADLAPVGAFSAPIELYVALKCTYTTVSIEIVILLSSSIDVSAIQLNTSWCEY